MTIQANLKLISIASDGAASEYNAQLELMKGHNTNNFLLYKDEIYNINFSAPIYENRPIIRVQDPKHSKNNGRNNVHSGAHLLMFGKDTIRYDQIFTLAKDDNSALYMRDVINVDKQDDGAAFRFFSSALLKQCQKNGIVESDKLGLFVYLFIFGKLFKFLT
jgi:hypothetical protein